MMLDFCCYPTLERLVMLENSPWKVGFDKWDLKNTCPEMYAYVHRYRAHPKMKLHCFQAKHNANMMNLKDANDGGVTPLQHAMVQD